MIDFSTLRALSPAEQQERDEASRERSYAPDDALRDASSKKALTITLTEEPSRRVLPSGERIVVLHGVEKDRDKPMAAVYVIPARVENDEQRMSTLDSTLRDLGGGDKVSLAGQWSKRNWKSGQGEAMSSWEFKTQSFEPGEHSLDVLKQRAIASRLPQVEIEQDRKSAGARAAAAARSARDMGA